MQPVLFLHGGSVDRRNQCRSARNRDKKDVRQRILLDRDTADESQDVARDLTNENGPQGIRV